MFLIIIGFLILLPTNELNATLSQYSLHKNHHTLSGCMDTYYISSTEAISLYGAKEKKWLTPNLFWGEAGYGAIGGIRSGYIEGGLIAGYNQSIIAPLSCELRIFFGAGGGGGAPQGGGMIIQPTLGLDWQLTPRTSITLELGYMHFINGNISSPSLGVALNVDYWALTYQESR